MLGADLLAHRFPLRTFVLDFCDGSFRRSASDGAIDNFDCGRPAPISVLFQGPLKKKNILHVKTLRSAKERFALGASILASGGPLEVLRMKLAQEPSIRGQK
jgi:hypothetical protein